MTDAPDEGAASLITTIAGGFGETEGWPLWQYVVLEMHRLGWDADVVWAGLPGWGDYRAVWTDGTEAGKPLEPAPPGPRDRVGLTVLGMAHANRRATNHLLETFLAVVTTCADREAELVPSPHAIHQLLVTGEEMAALPVPHPAAPVKPALLLQTMVHEPPTATGFARPFAEVTWPWEVTLSRVRHFRSVPDAEGYLQLLETMLRGADPSGRVAVPLPSRTGPSNQPVGLV